MNEEVETLPSNRKFGFTISAILMVISLFNFTSIKFYIFGSLGLLIALFALFAPTFLSIPNKAWMKLGNVMHKITNPIIITLLYFVVFCPTGFALKLFRRCVKEKDLNNKVLTYWNKKGNHSDFNSMKNQF